jgi:Holliday junction resolvase RusA-like endonuclease
MVTIVILWFGFCLGGDSIFSEASQVLWDFDAVILGEPQSAKNRRRIVSIGGKPRLIKSKKALDYEKTFLKQCPRCDPILEGDCALLIDVYYSSRRPDLACIDLVQDLLQGHAYLNDRQVKASQTLWNLDKLNPRCRIRVRSIQQDSSQGVSCYGQLEIWGEEATG